MNLIKIVKETNARKSGAIKYNEGSYLELDVWLPDQKITFEFQVSMFL